MIRIVIERDVRRPCEVGGRRCMFHRWVDVPVVVVADYGQRVVQMGLVEHGDGTMEQVEYSRVRFLK